MKRLVYIILSTLVLAGCSDLKRDNPYDGRLNTLSIKAVYPEEYQEFLREGVPIRVESVDFGYSYSAVTDAGGKAVFSVVNGLYRVMMSDRVEEDIFNGTSDRVMVVNGNVDMNLSLVYSKAGSIIIKEVYCGGCKRTPEQGDWQFDKYIILHNNDSQTQYLDGLCFGSIDPGNANQSSVWITKDEYGEAVFPDFIPIAQCVWQFGGNGDTFPLAPGEDAVIALNGAVDHAAQYPLSVNLNKGDYFVCYNTVYFPNPTYHPAPGSNIKTERWLNALIKMGIATAYSVSVSSPAILLFRPVDTTMQDFLLQDGVVVQKPGSSNDQVAKIPLDWIIDGVEVFRGSGGNNKRLPSSIDAGYVTQSDIYLGHTMHRRVDEELSASAGYEILTDTNNSSNDFYERSQQSLHE